MNSLNSFFCDAVLGNIRHQSTLQSLDTMLDTHNAGRVWEQFIKEHNRKRLEFSMHLLTFGNTHFIYHIRGGITLSQLDRMYHRGEQLVVSVSGPGDPDHLRQLGPMVSRRKAMEALRTAKSLCNYGSLQIFRKSINVDDGLERDIIGILYDGYYRSLKLDYIGWRGDDFLTHQLENVFLREVTLMGDWGPVVLRDIGKTVAKGHVATWDLEQCPEMQMSVSQFEKFADLMTNHKTECSMKLPFRFDLNSIESFMPECRDRQGHRRFGFFWRHSRRFGMMVTAHDSILQIKITKFSR